MRLTLCGSTRFKVEFHRLNHTLSCCGHTVYSLALFGKQSSDTSKGDAPTISDEAKMVLDLVHLDKILNSDAIIVINGTNDEVSNYIGDSTRREIRWARMQKKSVWWLDLRGAMKLPSYQTGDGDATHLVGRL